MSFDDAIIFDRVLPYVTNFSTAVDIGAHEGAWCDKMSNLFQRVYAFEPNNALCNRLSSVHAGTFGNMIVSNEAILDFNGKGTLYFDDRTFSSRGCFVKQNNDGDIDVKTLDSFRIKGCGLLKIDIEGGELLALRGARRIIRHQRPVIVVEHKYRQSARFGWKLNDLYSFMVEFKYRKVLEENPNLVFAVNR